MRQLTSTVCPEGWRGKGLFWSACYVLTNFALHWGVHASIVWWKSHNDMYICFTGTNRSMKLNNHFFPLLPTRVTCYHEPCTPTLSTEDTIIIHSDNITYTTKHRPTNTCACPPTQLCVDEATIRARHMRK